MQSIVGKRRSVVLAGLRISIDPRRFYQKILTSANNIHVQYGDPRIFYPTKLWNHVTVTPQYYIAITLPSIISDTITLSISGRENWVRTGL